MQNNQTKLTSEICVQTLLVKYATIKRDQRMNWPFKLF